jgi:hypothetical protein
MKVNVVCGKTFFHSETGRFYEAGTAYNVVPAPDIADFFAFEPELRAHLRAEHAKRFGKVSPERTKQDSDEAKRLAELAHKKEETTRIIPKTLSGLAAPASVDVGDTPTALSQLPDITPSEGWI